MKILHYFLFVLLVLASASGCAIKDIFNNENNEDKTVVETTQITKENGNSNIFSRFLNDNKLQKYLKKIKAVIQKSPKLALKSTTKVVDSTQFNDNMQRMTTKQIKAVALDASNIQQNGGDYPDDYYDFYTGPDYMNM